MLASVLFTVALGTEDLSHYVGLDLDATAATHPQEKIKMSVDQEGHASFAWRFMDNHQPWDIQVGLSRGLGNSWLDSSGSPEHLRAEVVDEAALTVAESEMPDDDLVKKVENMLENELNALRVIDPRVIDPHEKEEAESFFYTEYHMRTAAPDIPENFIQDGFYQPNVGPVRATLNDFCFGIGLCRKAGSAIEEEVQKSFMPRQASPGRADGHLRGDRTQDLDRRFALVKLWMMIGLVASVAFVFMEAMRDLLGKQTVLTTE
jgi:hypothetical protein